ncbi:DUF5996 family protein [Nostoc sp. XA010]|uniref:DUF5996 family protein n=1 Tax=Nostoc sp. XA010 TaxID=2780407 RepID=UPI001E60AF4D|nr:DUF5996 family protein [Nostoc sp. XA010]MCC5660996.1 DUF5996 family protein [Nostoc sp. XA010]
MATLHLPPTDIWLPFPIAAWQDTYKTLHLWTQIVGKIRLALAPKINHWWHSTLYVTPCGLTTSTIPYRTGNFQITFNFILHQLLIETSDGTTKMIELAPRSVADFYQAVFNTLKEIGIEVRIWTMPQEVVTPIPFEQDEEHASYDWEYAQRFWQILVQAERILTQFRSGYAGKCSPVHFFWGSFDLAVTRFSGQRAPEHPGGVPNMADWVTREAYSHEVSSCGFWFGDGSAEALFYAYAYPEPEGFKDYLIQPQSAFYSLDMKEFILPYETVRQANDPDAMALVFLQSTYEAAANAAQWDRTALEYNPVVKS